MMRELVTEVVDRRTTLSEKRADETFVTRDYLKNELSPINKQLRVIGLRLDGMDSKLDMLTLNDQDTRARLYRLEQQSS